jgi:hypothetical protein
MRVTIEKKTDQLNYEDFLHGITRVVTITGVKKGTKEQQYDIAIEGDNRVWRPAVTVLKLLVEAWGDDATQWVGRSALLYGDPDVTFGRDKVGGIRVSHVSHIDKPLTVKLTVTRGKRDSFTLEPLEDAPAQKPNADIAARAKSGIDYFYATHNITQDQLEERVGKPVAKWTAADVDALQKYSTELTQANATETLPTGEGEQ